MNWFPSQVQNLFFIPSNILSPPLCYYARVKLNLSSHILYHETGRIWREFCVCLDTTATIAWLLHCGFVLRVFILMCTVWICMKNVSLSQQDWDYVSDGPADSGLANMFRLADVTRSYTTSTSTTGDIGRVRMDKVMQMCQRLWGGGKNDSTFSRRLKIISRCIRNSLWSNADSSSVGSSREGQTRLNRKSISWSLLWQTDCVNRGFI